MKLGGKILQRLSLVDGEFYEWHFDDIHCVGFHKMFTKQGKGGGNQEKQRGELEETQKEKKDHGNEQRLLVVKAATAELVQ